MNSSLFSLVLFLVAGLVWAEGGCGRHSAAEQATDDPKSQAAVDRVTAGHPQRKTLTLYTSQPGRIEAFEEAPLHPKISGYIEEVLVDIGDPVQKDQTLIRLWIPEMVDERKQKEALAAQAEAEVKQAEAALAAAEAAVESAEAQIDLAEAGVGRTEGEYERWKAEHARMQELATGGSVTQKLADETLNQFRAADAARRETLANVSSAKAAYSEARANVHKAQADRTTAAARLNVAQADLNRTKTLLDYAELKAPFNGVVTRRNVDAGHLVHPGNGIGKPLLVVAQADTVRVFVEVPELEAPLVDAGAEGDLAVVRVRALGNREFPAQVTRTGWSLDASNRTLLTEIDIPNPEGILRPGMYAVAVIRLEERSDVLAIPVTAVVREGDDVFCYAVVDGRLERKPIELGLRVGREVEVRSGLAGSDVIVLNRTESLRPGQAVERIASQ